MIYQDINGKYLPEDSQPLNNNEYKVNPLKYNPHMSTRYINVIKKSDDDTVQKNLPELYKRREECCGCTACYAICPVKAICMRPDEEGFLYPVIDSKKCIRCYKCQNISPLKMSSYK